MKNWTLGWIQAGVCLLLYLLLLIYSSHRWTNWTDGVLYTTVGMAFYLLAVYAHAYLLWPRFIEARRYTAYAMGSLTLLGGLVALRMWIEYELFYLGNPPQLFFNWTMPHFAFDLLTLFLAFGIGFLLRIGINYLKLLRRQEQMHSQQLAAELALLKAQVQPHFLFNTLNNIYSLAVTGSPETASVVARLSDSMRYFVDEAPKDAVPLGKELTFIQNYIELERIRLRYPLHLEWQVDLEEPAPLVPPMLLIPFVENVFKHGIDKMLMDNCVSIRLLCRDGRLEYVVKNRLYARPEGPWRGLANLARRLELAFPGRYALQAGPEEALFVATLSVNYHVDKLPRGGR